MIMPEKCLPRVWKTGTMESELWWQEWWSWSLFPEAVSLEKVEIEQGI